MANTANRPSKVLVLETDATKAADLSRRVRFLNYEPVVTDTACAVRDLEVGGSIALMLGDSVLSGDLESAVKDLLAQRPTMPVLLASTNGEAGKRICGGPAWQLDMPIRRRQLASLLKRAERYDGREQRQRVTGNSASIQDVRRLIEQVAEFNTTVLITGESGTGKEVVARTIHDLSERNERPFVPINCGAIPPDLLESELFGHEKGAFTGAVAARTGRFELAEGGTLFLDEIGDMSLPMQVKLLRVLQERTFERVGSNVSRHTNVRVVAATHHDLSAMVAAGEFRQDLYYRLNVFPIHMPPLRKRISDLPDLLTELLHHGSAPVQSRLSAGALSALSRYSWPGNIRELGNLVERLAIMHPDGEIALGDLPEKYRRPPVDGAHANPVAVMASPVVANLKQYIQDVEQDLIRQALSAAGGVVAKAARNLKMQRTTLLEKINKYQLQ